MVFRQVQALPDRMAGSSPYLILAVVLVTIAFALNLTNTKFQLLCDVSRSGKLECHHDCASYHTNRLWNKCWRPPMDHICLCSHVWWLPSARWSRRRHLWVGFHDPMSSA
ncbi:aminotriazole resistance protein [Alternaria alternata]|nr:aminotriazole resistance protein [Alternaria alternata]